MTPSVDGINASTYSLTDIPIKGQGRTVRLTPSEPSDNRSVIDMLTRKEMGSSPQVVGSLSQRAAHG